jgi:hypothetical protein
MTQMSILGMKQGDVTSDPEYEFDNLEKINEILKKTKTKQPLTHNF